MGEQRPCWNILHAYSVATAGICLIFRRHIMASFNPHGAWGATHHPEASCLRYNVQNDCVVMVARVFGRVRTQHSYGQPVF